MQLVRCEQCGAKALIAASQCPRCAHAFFLRNSRGETVPLGHCNVCDTYYPRSRGGCRWCGTTVSKLPIGFPALLLGLLLAVGVVSVGVWQYRARTGNSAERQGDSVGATAPGRVDPLVQGGGPAPAAASVVVPEAVLAPLSDSIARGDSGAARGASADAQSSAAATSTTPPPVAAPAAISPAADEDRPPPASYAGPWTRAVARSWVNVRGTASIDAAIVGVVTPNARVELGDVRGGWRRVRSAGVQGWADASFFAVDSTGR